MSDGFDSDVRKMANTVLRTVSDTTLVHDSLILLREILRNNVTDPLSRGTSATDTFTGDGTTSAFVLTNQPLNVTSITVAGSSQTIGVNFTITYDTKTITFQSGYIPTNGQAISVTYKYSSTNASLVYTAYPDTNAVYPQISLTHAGGSDEWMSLGTDYKEVTVNVAINIFTKLTRQRDELWDSVYDTLRQQKSVLEQNGISDLTIIRADNIEGEATKESDIHQKSCEISFHCYATS